jgi:putative oxidoreductase
MNNYIKNTGFLFLRIFVGGTMLLAHGASKLLHPERFIEALRSNGFPFPHILAYFSIAAETIFPLLIILGLFTRVSALIAAINMFVALFVFHLTIKGDPFANFEKAFLYLIVFIFIAIAGGGGWTLKRLFDKNGVS